METGGHPASSGAQPPSWPGRGLRGPWTPRDTRLLMQRAGVTRGSDRGRSSPASSDDARNERMNE